MKQLLLITGTAALLSASEIAVSIDLNNSYPISPLIYGYNQNHEDSTKEAMNLTARRLGGNRLSTFNWEENVENSGEGTNSSFCYIHGTIVGGLWNDQFIAGNTYQKFHQDNLDNNITSIVTVPLLGWVAADKDRTVPGGPATAPTRWKELIYQKPAPFSLTPDTTDDVVYLDESVNYMVETFGDATEETGVKYIALGNEPGLWENTHELVQETDLTVAEYIEKTIAAAKAVKAVAPTVKLIAGEFAGINIYDLGSAPDWSSLKGDYNWFIDYFLDTLKRASDEVGYPLIDVLSFHNYPQHKVDQSGAFSGSGTVVRTSALTDDYIRQARMSFPRSMWDTTYIEPSWLTGAKLNGEYHAILKRMQQSIDTYFPGIEIMIGEFDYGHDTDISHGIAMADLLGILGANRVAIATRWDLDTKSTNTYTESAYKLFRNYDGLGSTIGDEAIKVSFDSPETGSAWLSRNSETGNLHLVLINKSIDETTQFTLPTGSLNDSYRLSAIYGFDQTSTAIQPIPMALSLDTDCEQYTLPPLSAYHVILEPTGTVALKVQKEMTAPVQFTTAPGSLTIELAQPETVQFSIHSVTGRKLSSETLTGKDHYAISTENLGTGIFVAKISSGSVTTTKRFMVK